MFDWLRRKAAPEAPRPAPAAAAPAAPRRPEEAKVQHKLSQQRRSAGDRAGAIAACRAALSADPQHAAAHNDLGSLLRESGDDAAALGHFEAAVAADPALSEAWFNLGALKLDLGRAAESAEALSRSLALQPRQADAQYWRGNALMAQGEVAAASAAYEAALKIDAGFLRARWALANARLVPVPADVKAEAASRASFDTALGQLSTWLRTRVPADAHEAVASTQPFYLAYLPGDPKPLLARYGSLCAQTMGAWARRAKVAPKPPAPGRPRIGIVSAHLHDHSVWNAMLAGWLEHRDRSAFEWHLFQIGSRSDAQTARAKSLCDRFHGPLGSWQQAGQSIAEAGLSVLLYPEIGMDSITGKLAALRLAPVQAASWGHPLTSGLPTMDHFLSAAGMEPAAAVEHYTERVALLPGLGCTPRRYGTRPQRPDLAAAGIARGTRVLLCPGMPFKYRPGEDALWVEIARRAAPCRLVFFEGGAPGLHRALKARLEAAFGDRFADQVLFVPWQGQAAFFGWLAAADVFLDSVGFSGFNTVMQAIECGTPVVTLEGEALRARFGAGILRALGLDEWVATDPAGYVERAVRLAGDAAAQQAVRRRIAAGRDALFDDAAASRALGPMLAQWLSAASTESSPARR